MVVSGLSDFYGMSDWSSTFDFPGTSDGFVLVE